jgi:N-acetylglucosaminyldiphosphoundecaprenol N-acetyl-beta-D-mannosaminyltransferase
MRRARAGADRVEVGCVGVDNLTEDETLKSIDRLIAAEGSHFMAVVNAGKIAAATRDEDLRRVLASADLVTADGMSVVWAAKLLGHPLKGRVTGIDMLGRLVAHAARRGLSVYFLGAKQESVRGTVSRFTDAYPALRVAGFRDGYFDQRSDEVAQEVKRSGADLLFVALGSPAQEKWISSNLAITGARFALGVGGSFDHVSGLSSRAPKWMQQAGLEWFYRLLREPRRMWRRYLVGNTLFIGIVLKQLLHKN